MHQRNKKAAILVSFFLMICIVGFAQNPIIQTIFTADPAPMVYQDTVYLYTGHDQDGAGYFDMRDWHIYSTTDMVNWTDRGIGLSIKDFKWANKDAWAGQCIYRNGKFYWYVPINKEGAGMSIGVAVSDHPTGPFKDAIERPLIEGGWGYIDPTVFIDNDGQAYLYWGNPTLYYVKLNKDMVSYDHKVGIVKVPLDRAGFGIRVIDANKTFSWADTVLVEQSECFQEPKTNKFYWYTAAIDHSTGQKVIGVAVADKIIGPYKDVLNKPLITENCDTGNINPTVIVDDHNDTLLFWGNKALFNVKLNADRMSYASKPGIQVVSKADLGKIQQKITAASSSNGKRVSAYEEGPWFYRRKDRYYLIYPAGGVPEHLAYSTSLNPTGPWHYQDTIMSVIGKGGAFTNHPGVIDYKGKSFFFYHNGALPGGGGFDRSVCVEPFNYNADGTIPRISPTKQGVKHSLAPLNPYIRQEAETIAWEQGVETATSTIKGVYVTDLQEGAYIKVRDVNINKGAKAFKAEVWAAKSGGSIEIYVDSIGGGSLIGSLKINATGKTENWQVQSTKLRPAQGLHEGLHDLYFVFKVPDKNTFNFNWWQIKGTK